MSLMDQRELQQPPRKSSPPSQPPQSTTTKPWFRIPWEGKRKIFTGIKASTRYHHAQSKEPLHPFQNRSVGGVNFPRFTQRPIAEPDGDKYILTLSPPEPGGFFELTYPQVQRGLNSVARRVVRWINFDLDENGNPDNPHRVAIPDLMEPVYEIDQVTGKASPIGLMYTPLEGDEPLAAYLVLIPREDVDRLGGRDGIQGMPSMLDLDPTMDPRKKDSRKETEAA